MWKAFSALLRGHITQLLPVLILSWPLLRFCNFSYVAPLPSLYAFTTSTLQCVRTNARQQDLRRAVCHLQSARRYWYQDTR